MSNNQKSEADLAYERELRIYFFKAFVYEFSKIIIFLCFAAFFNIVKEYLVALLFLMLVRTSGGGLHLRTYIGCLIVSFIFLYSSIFLAWICKPHQVVMAIILAFCALIGRYLVPITSDNRPEASIEQVRNSKRNTFIIIISMSILICICPLNIYSYICFWTVVLHLLQLFFAHYIKRRNQDV